jgi:hypothetical protein
MMLRLVIALSLLTALMSGPVAAATRPERACPIAPFQLAAVEAAIRRTRSCDAAMAIFDRCGVGTSADLHTGNIVIRKCEAAFAGRLPPAQMRAYARAKHVCAAKYVHESGTMYRSFEAYCTAQAAHRMARQALKAARRPARR